MTDTIKAQVLKHLKKHGNISPREIYIDYGGASPTKVIHTLREDGWNIISVPKKHPVKSKRYVRYFMVDIQQVTGHSKLESVTPYLVA